MRKKLFNHHRFTKKWKRHLDGSHPVLLRSHEEARSTKDFAWHRPKTNPYYQGRVDWRKRAQIFVCLASCVIAGGLAVYHPFFHIRDISIKGAERLNSQDISNAVTGMMEYRKAFILPANSYFLVDVHEITDILTTRFPLSSVTVSKQFPHGLTVELKEKISTVIYDNGKEYSYLGLDGNIVEIVRKVGEDEWVYTTKTVTSTYEHGKEFSEQKKESGVHTPPLKAIRAELGDYPLVYDLIGKEGKINDDVLRPEFVAGVITWFDSLRTNTDIPFGYIIMEDGLGNALIKTQEHWDIKIKLGNDVPEQMEQLQTALKSTDINRKQLQYIDLRYPGRVYWQ